MPKIIEIRRKPYTRDPKFGKPQEVIDSEKSSIGSCMKGSQSLKGLTALEEQMLMPSIIGIGAGEHNFHLASNGWFDDIKHIVGPIGLRLDISLIDDSQPLLAKLENGIVNYPNNIEEYVLYRYCLAYPDVANTKEELNSNPSARFYIHSVEADTKLQNDKFRMRMTAMNMFTKVMSNELIVNAIMRILAGKSREQKKNIITVREPEKLDLLTKQNMLADVINKFPEEFTDVVKDPELTLRAEVYEMIDRGIIESTGSKFIFQGEELGKTVEHALAFVKASANSKFYVMMKGKLESMNDKPSARIEAVAAIAPVENTKTEEPK